MNNNYYLFFVSGLLGAFAYDDLSYKKDASQSSTWVGGSSYFAINAVDGHPLTCMRTLDIGINSLIKTVWWKVDLGDVYNIHSINIIFKNYNGIENKQRGRFAGFSLYVSNNDISSTNDIQRSMQCYMDGNELPPLNFSTTCTEYGRYVVFYNERLTRVKYPSGYELENVITELCEVTVHGCSRPNVYGFECDKHCPKNCKSNICHIQEGFCFACTSGWAGQYCNTTCTLGWYGQNCSKKCIGHCKDNSSCNHVTGMCDKGCDGGWTGKLCNDECVNGTFGYDCVNNCSGHCLNNSPCNKLTGNCEWGCKPGYTNGDCKKKFLQSQKSTTWTVEFSISFAINIVFVSVMCSSFWIICARRIFRSRDHPSCFKSEYYTDTEVKTDEASNYQELKLSGKEIDYQNLTLK